MNTHHKTPLKHVSLLLYLLTLTLFLVACGDSGNKTTTGPTPTPTSPPTPTPTPTPTLIGTTYTGDGFTLTYPQGWTADTQTGGVQFKSNTDPTTTFNILVEPADPAAQGLDWYLNKYLTFLKGDPPSATQDNTVPSTATIAGDVWKAGGVTGDDRGQRMKVVVLVDQHPANTGKIFLISLTAKADGYDQVSSTAFQPMLGSFKFTA
jgi:hypothetical protein